LTLTDREIQIAIENRQIVVDPGPPPEFFSSTSVDLRLSERIRVWNPPGQPMPGVEQGLVLSPGAPGYSYDSVVRQFSTADFIGAGGHVLQPGAFLVGWTIERVEIPNTSRVAARVEGKSSLARLGVGVHITAPTIHAGFAGQIQLEIKHQGTVPVRLVPGMKVCQLIFEQTLGVPNKGYAGIFLGQAAE
jgi:dCTP deaminase